MSPSPPQALSPDEEDLVALYALLAWLHQGAEEGAPWRVVPVDSEAHQALTQGMVPFGLAERRRERHGQGYAYRITPLGEQRYQEVMAYVVKGLAPLVLELMEVPE